MCSRPRRLAACGGGDAVDAPNIRRRTRRKTGAGTSASISSSFRLTARSAALQILAVAATRQSSGADSQKPSSIGPVVTMLEGMRQQNEKEARIAREEQDALEHECEQTKIQEEKELAVLRTSLTSETAKREESSALVVKSSDAIAAASEKQQALGKNLAAEKKIFAEEKAEFAKLDKESAQTIDMVRRAIRALTLKKSKGGQDGAGGAALLQRALDGVQTAVSAITKASFVSTGGVGGASSREKLRALLQQPQAVDQGLDTESGMGGVIDMFEKFLQDEIANRSQRQQEWSENQMKKQLLVQQISNNVANTVTFLEREKSKKAQAEENQAKAAGAMATLNEEIGKCQKTLSDSQTKYRIATKEFEEEQADFAAELKALTAAMDILQKAPDFLQQETASGALPLPARTSFVQMSSRTTSRMKKVRSGSGAGVEEEVEVDEDDAGTMNGSTSSLQDIKSETSASLAVQKLQRQTRASIYLQKLAGPHKNLLYQLSIKVAEDPFEKVKSMIANMVAKLEKEMAEAASKEQYCQTETAKGSKDLKQKTLEKEKLTMRKEKAMADKTKLEKTIAQLENRIQEINADKETMTSTRAKNKKQNEEEMEVALKNEEACGKAIQVLQEYFATSGGASFLQTEASTSTGVQNVGDSVIALLETAEADFAKTKIDLQNLEQSLKTQYDEKMQDYREELATTKATIKGYEGEVATLNTQIADAETDEANAGKEEAASAQYLDKIKEECETKAPSFEERQKRREEEIEGLKNAIEILEGETAGAA